MLLRLKASVGWRLNLSLVFFDGHALLMLRLLNSGI